MRRIAEQAERAGKVIKSVHDFVRRRDAGARGRARRRTCSTPSCRWCSLQARKLGVRVRAGVRDGPAAGAVRPHHGRAGAAEPGAQRHAGHGRAGHCPERVLRACRCGAPAPPSARRIPPAGSSSRWPTCGPGIADEVAQQLFTPFFTTKPEGMGLGLSLCRTVVEQHGGFLATGAEPAAGHDFPLHAARVDAPAAAAADHLIKMPHATRCRMPPFSSSTTTPACAKRWPGCCARAVCPASRSTAPRRSRLMLDDRLRADPALLPAARRAHAGHERAGAVRPAGRARPAAGHAGDLPDRPCRRADRGGGRQARRLRLLREAVFRQRAGRPHRAGAGSSRRRSCRRAARRPAPAARAWPS